VAESRLEKPHPSGGTCGILIRGRTDLGVLARRKRGGEFPSKKKGEEKGRPARKGEWPFRERGDKFPIIPEEGRKKKPQKNTPPQKGEPEGHSSRGRQMKDERLTRHLERRKLHGGVDQDSGRTRYARDESPLPFASVGGGRTRREGEKKGMGRKPRKEEDDSRGEGKPPIPVLV